MENRGWMPKYSKEDPACIIGYALRTPLTRRVDLMHAMIMLMMQETLIFGNHQTCRCSRWLVHSFHWFKMRLTMRLSRKDEMHVCYATCLAIRCSWGHMCEATILKSRNQMKNKRARVAQSYYIWFELGWIKMAA